MVEFGRRAVWCCKLHTTVEALDGAGSKHMDLQRMVALCWSSIAAGNDGACGRGPTDFNLAA
jgi:hypothetical protein